MPNGNWFIVRVERSHICNSTITHQRCCQQLNAPNDVRGHTSSVWVHSANQIILYHFALVIYDEFDDNAMVATYAVSLSMCYCTFVLATVSHNYSDILEFGTSEIDDSLRNPDAITAN